MLWFLLFYLENYISSVVHILEASNRDEPLLQIPSVNDAKTWSPPKVWAVGLTPALFH